MIETAPRDYAVLGWLVAAAFVVILNETMMMNAIPRLMVDLSINETSAQWLSTAFMLTMAVVIPITGWFLQRVTTRQAYGLAMTTFCRWRRHSGLRSPASCCSSCRGAGSSWWCFPSP